MPQENFFIISEKKYILEPGSFISSFTFLARGVKKMISDEKSSPEIAESNKSPVPQSVLKAQGKGNSPKMEQLALLSSALEHLSEMVVITDLDHNIIYVNKASNNILGYNPEELIGHKAAEFFEGVPGNPPSLAEETAKNSINGTWKGDIFNRKKDGTLINIHLALSWLYDKNNDIIGCVGVSTDITDRKKLEKELREANQALKELDRLKSDFLTSTSHELRTPLTSIKSFVDILLSEEEEDKATKREFLTIIKEDTERLSRLVNNVLDISRIETGTISWNNTTLNLEDEIKKAIRSMDGLARKKEITIDLVKKGGPYPVFVDPDRIQQVVVNLLSNAIDFSPPRSPIVVNIVSQKNRNIREVKVSVIDRGPGITSVWQNKIFDKFMRITDKDKVRTGGTGLGLSICREIITHYNGKIQVISNPPDGSTFIFSLPLGACPNNK